MFVIRLCWGRSWIQSNKKKKENENKRKKSQRTWPTAFFLKSVITQQFTDDPILMLKFIQTSFIAITKNYSDFGEN